MTGEIRTHGSVSCGPRSRRATREYINKGGTPASYIFGGSTHQKCMPEQIDIVTLSYQDQYQTGTI